MMSRTQQRAARRAPEPDQSRSGRGAAGSAGAADTRPRTASSPTSRQNPLPRATPAETVQVLRDVQAPMVAKGPIIRRPGVVAAVERLGLEARAVSRLQGLSAVYGRGPLMLAVPGRNMAVVLDPEHVHRVLEETPEPFAAEETMKRHALKHFEPKVALISHGTERHERRRINEQALNADHPVHHMAESFMPVVCEEADALLREVEAGVLSWDDFERSWHRVIRRTVLGDSFRDDVEITELLEKLRADGNWAFLKPVDTEARERFHESIHAALDRAEPGSLAAYMHGASADVPDRGHDDGTSEREAKAQQIPQWLFAFDPAGMATFRALALLASHPERLEAARLQIAEESTEAAPTLPILRASVLESLRLWATTPMILRETTMEVEFEHGVMPAGTSVLIFAPFFHRDERHLDFAHRFAPELWERERTRQDWPLMPFSLGTGICPGRHLVLLLTSNFLAQIVKRFGVELTSHELEPGSLPALLNNYGLQFRLTGR